MFIYIYIDLKSLRNLQNLQIYYKNLRNFQFFMHKTLKRRLKTFNAPRNFRFSSTADSLHTRKFPSNYISTTKYTLITFLPKSLLFQFKRYANIYFLIIAILQSISIISPLNPFTALAPFVFVIGLSILREAYEDYQRYKSDIEINSFKTTVLLPENNAKTPTLWADIEVGSLLIIKENEQLPADLVLLGSSLENGSCFIQTSSLDGEKTLKPKHAVKETAGFFDDCSNLIENSAELFEIELYAQSPDQNLYAFEGSFSLKNEKILLGPKQLLLRGSQLRNTKWAVGVVVYTGMDTKIMRNSERCRQKSSEIERKTNKLIIFLLIFQVVCSLICALMNFSFNSLQLPRIPYLNSEYSPGLEAFMTFWSYFLLFNTMLPISLIVSLEFVKIFQAYFISCDDFMYTKENNRFCKVMTSSINEELGQVQYIFSDKTGTLTCNKMEFKIAMIGNQTFGESQIDSEQAYKTIKKMNKSQNLKNYESVFTFRSKKLENILGEQQFQIQTNLQNLTESEMLFGKGHFGALAVEYWQILASCHECVAQMDENGCLIYQVAFYS